MADAIEELADRIRDALTPLEQNDPRELAIAVQYWVWRHLFPGGPPSTDPHEILSQAAGECGQRSILCATLLDVLGIDTRLVSLANYRGPGDIAGRHIMFEAFVDDRWAVFDPLIGAFFTDDGTPTGRVLSMAEIVAGDNEYHFVPFNGGVADQHSVMGLQPTDPTWTMPAFYIGSAMLQTTYGMDNNDRIQTGFTTGFDFVETDPGGRFIYQASLQDGVWTPLAWDQGHIAVPAAGISFGTPEAGWNIADSNEIDDSFRSLQSYSNFAVDVAIDFTTAGRYFVVLWPSIHSRANFPLDVVKLGDAGADALSEYGSDSKDNAFLAGPTTTLLSRVELLPTHALSFEYVAAAGDSIAVRPSAGARDLALYVDAWQIIPVESDTHIYEQYLYSNYNHSVQGGSGADYIVGGPGDDLLKGGGSDDMIIGGGGSDVLYGDGGANTLIGGPGNDVYYVNSLANVTIEQAGEGLDSIIARVSGWELQADFENLWLIDSATTGWGNSGDNMLKANPALGSVLHGRTGNDSLVGGTGSDWLYGDAGNDTLTGNAGNDILIGGYDNVGVDAMRGGPGDDVYYVYNVNALVTELPGEGLDSVVTSVSGWHLGPNVENLWFINDATLGWGNGGDNVLIGNPSLGTAFDGGAGNDRLIGGTGNDTLYGGLGSDQLSGASGRDTFVFSLAPSRQNIDRILDFSPGEDIIMLYRSVFTGLAAGTLDANAFWTGTAAHDANDRVIWNGTTGALSYDVDGSGAAAALQFALLSPGLSIDHGDFLII